MFTSIDQMWISLLTRLLEAKEKETPSRDGDVCGEIIGYSERLGADSQRTLLMNPERALSAPYAAAEVLWYAGGTGAIKMLEAYAPNYRKFIGDKELSAGAYGPRLMWKIEDEPSQIMCAVKTLQRSLTSRQSVVSIWHPEDVWTAMDARPDVPCTLTWQFLVRNNALHMTVNMRSNDAWMGFPYDVFAFTCYQRLVAAELGVHVGVYVHNVGSMHLYERDRAKAERAITYKVWKQPTYSHDWELDDGLESSLAAARVEEKIRTNDSNFGRNDMELDYQLACGHMFKDLVHACATRSNPDVAGRLEKFRSEAFRALCDRRP